MVARVLDGLSPPLRWLKYSTPYKCKSTEQKEPLYEKDEQ
jgi:hypothetical protein